MAKTISHPHRGIMMACIWKPIAIAIVGLSIACSALGTADQKKQQEEEQTNMMLLAAVAYSATRTLPIQGSCTYGSTCLDYNTGWSSSQMTTDCASTGGTYTSSTAGCTATNKVASCAVSGRGWSFVTGTTATFRYYSPITVGNATTSCNSMSANNGTLSVP